MAKIYISSSSKKFSKLDKKEKFNYVTHNLDYIMFEELINSYRIQKEHDSIEQEYNYFIQNESNTVDFNFVREILKFVNKKCKNVKHKIDEVVLKFDDLEICKSCYYEIEIYDSYRE